MSYDGSNYILKVEIDDTARITYQQKEGPFDWEVTRAFDEVFARPEYKDANIKTQYDGKTSTIVYTVSNVPLDNKGPIIPSFTAINQKIRYPSLEQKVLNDSIHP